MSHESKHKRWNPFHAAQAAGTAVAEVAPKERVQVEQLIANGKQGIAVDIAKQVHKRVGNAASEELLVCAYAARIISLAERDLDVEARALLELVQGRHPSSRDRLREVAATLKARGGGIEGLLELLVDPSLPAEKVAGIEARIQAAAGDPAQIARCNTLPLEHPLRMAANAVVRALGAVTSGPVPAESLVLPEISRHSPLAPWKMLLRAIQALYANEDALCEKYLAAVETTAAAARVVPAMRALMGQKQKLSPAAQDLVRKAGGGFAELHTTLANLDQALDKNNQGLVVQEIGRAVTLCKQVCPEQVERIKQHISVRAMMSGSKVERVTAAMGGPSLKNAYFWRLLARGYEQTPHNPLAIPLACSVWDEFRKHAVHEKWFPAKGPEVATLYLHMAELWRRIDDEQIGHVVQRFAATFPGHAVYYAGQPSEIRALMPSGRLDCYFLSSDALFGRACEADPCTENFQRWLKWAVQNAPVNADLVAERWAAALPLDIPPVLHLMQSAESSNALKRAFKLMEQAERLDGLNPDVRRARLRLLISLATRHLQQKKTHLAEPELRQIEELPQAQQGDRPALAAALRWVYWMLRGETSRADEVRARVVSLLGSEAAGQIVLKAVASACKLKDRVPESKSAGGPLASAVGRACALGEDTGLPIVIPPALSNKLQRELSGRDVTADATGLVALGEAASRACDLPLAYAVSAVGLKLAEERWAEFLFLRARALPDWEEERQALCAAGASELARRQRNADLLRRIGEWREEEMMGMRGSEADVAMSSEQINTLIQRELKERGFPDFPDQSGDYDGACDCPVCRANREGLPPALERMMEEIGPEELIKAMGEMLRGGGMTKPRKRRGSRRVFDENELPF